MSNPYAILGVAPTATAEEIRRAWLRLVAVAHPDHAGPEMTDEVAHINAAYNTLRDPAKRARVDLDLGSAGTRPAEPQAAPSYAPPPPEFTHPQPGWQAAYAADLAARYAPPGFVAHASLSERVAGLPGFLVADHRGQWLVALAWLALLSFAITPFAHFDSATWMFCAVVGLGIQSAAARHFHHTPLADLCAVGVLGVRAAASLAGAFIDSSDKPKIGKPTQGSRLPRSGKDRNWTPPPLEDQWPDYGNHWK